MSTEVEGMSPQRALAIFWAADGKCRSCGRKLSLGDEWSIVRTDDNELAPECDLCPPDKEAIHEH